MTSQGWSAELKPAKSSSCYSEAAPQTSESCMHLNVHIFCRSQKSPLLLAKQHISLIWCGRNMLHSFMDRMLTSPRINIYTREHNELACFVLCEFKTGTLGKEWGALPLPQKTDKLRLRHPKRVLPGRLGLGPFPALQSWLLGL